ncbi:DUF3870 domain-containing protein [Bacillus bingmayongensis]|uniref:DUF3870 domain-containing protein n=1 Tax=Bacillus bingmayongensis TaxID=1150157 RepID=UPI001C8ED56D|nr:DUF3870 domain-containing protein [Bacillus bingmayongensis]MBY0597763.1 DUF3870 domain-containing protein [Bacillus bingmayongensis]
MRKGTFFMAGHSRLPKGIAVRSVYETLTITIEADHKYHVIIEASCTLATEHGRDFISQILRGHSLRDGIEEIIQEISYHYQGKAQNAIISALKDLYRQYTNYVNGEKPQEEYEETNL